MTGSASGPPRDPEPVLDEDWRRRRELQQQTALSDGSTVVSCSALRGAGGLGRHSEEIERAVERAGGSPLALSGAVETGARPAIGMVRRAVRFSAPWRAWVDCVAYDRYAARRLSSAEHLIVFNGESLGQIRAARRRGIGTVSLVSANSHLRRVRRQHELARRRYPLERPWSERLLARNLREYEAADRILCSSAYIWESFLEQGFPEERLAWFPLIPEARYAPAVRQAGEAETFEVLYIGTLTVAKGVPLLIDAFRRLGHSDLRLVLVGGPGTRGMRRFVERACAEDRRISLRPGAVLERLRTARLCVHATYEDGFAYAPAEALAAGVPTIVSADTGMKELISAGRNGLVLETGAQDALSEAIDAAYRGEILGG
jgi:glycosyltransferase involved in cell wall biosynthesis